MVKQAPLASLWKKPEIKASFVSMCPFRIASSCLLIGDSFQQLEPTHPRLLTISCSFSHPYRFPFRRLCTLTVGEPLDIRRAFTPEGEFIES
jgi:hypothetical protein